jgi:hypothetical protein
VVETRGEKPGLWVTGFYFAWANLAMKHMEQPAPGHRGTIAAVSAFPIAITGLVLLLDALLRGRRAATMRGLR